MADLLLMAVCAVLLVTPGAWFAFGVLGRDTPYQARLSLSIALSPAVVGLQMLALTNLGATFAQAALLLLANVLALVLMRPGRVATPGVADAGFLVQAACFLLMAGGLVALWTMVPLERIYSWHNMMQAAAAYSLTALPARPEEWSLAGLPLQYAWIGHVQIAAIARLCDVPPLRVFPAVNLMALLAMYVLLVEAVLRLRPARQAAAAVAATLAILSTNLLGMIVALAPLPWRGGELRVSTLLIKHLNFDMMTGGEALLAGAVFCALVVLQQRSWRAWSGLIVCIVGLGFTYPFLSPAALALGGAVFLAPLAERLLRRQPVGLGRDEVGAAAGLALAAGLFLVALAITVGPSAGGLVRFADFRSLRHAVIAEGFAVAAWAPFILIAGWRACRARNVEQITLLLVGGGFLAFFLVLRMPASTEYKFLFSAFLILLPLVADAGIGVFSQVGVRSEAESPTLRAGRSALTAVCLFAVAAIAGWHLVRDHVPWRVMRDAPALDESRFAVRPAGRALAWMVAVQERTPPDTVLVSPPDVAPTPVLTQRASYISLDPQARRQSGYSMRARFILGDVKGLPTKVLDARAGQIAAIYGGTSGGDWRAMMAQLEQMGRPVAIYAPRANAFVGWLRTSGRGRAVFEDAAHVLWLVDPPRARAERASQP